MAAPSGQQPRTRATSSANPFNDASVAATATVPVPDMPRRRGNTAQAAEPAPVMYLSAQGSNSVEQAAHKFLATADVPVPGAGEQLPEQLAQCSRWENLLAAVPNQQHGPQLNQGDLFKRVCSLLVLNRTMSATVELQDAFGADLFSLDTAAVSVEVPLLLLAAYVGDAADAAEGTSQQCSRMGQLIAACWALVDGIEMPGLASPSTCATVKSLPPVAALAWGTKACVMCSTLWLQAHQAICVDMASGSAPSAAARFPRSAAYALLGCVQRVWQQDTAQLKEQWRGQHALAALTCAVSSVTSLVRVYLHVGQLQAAASGQQLLQTLARAAEAAAPAGDSTAQAVLQLMNAVVLSCDASLGVAQGDPSIALVAAEEADTAALAATPPPLAEGGGEEASTTTCSLGDAQALHILAQNAVRSGCSCLCMAGSVLAGKAWHGLRLGNQLIASNAPAYMGMSKAICSNVTTMYDLTSTKTDAQFAREVLTQVASKYHLAQVLQGGWIKTI